MLSIYVSSLLSVKNKWQKIYLKSLKYSFEISTNVCNFLQANQKRKCLLFFLYCRNVCKILFYIWICVSAYKLLWVCFISRHPIVAHLIYASLQLASPLLGRIIWKRTIGGLLGLKLVIQDYIAFLFFFLLHACICEPNENGIWEIIIRFISDFIYTRLYCFSLFNVQNESNNYLSNPISIVSQIDARI